MRQNETYKIAQPVADTKLEIETSRLISLIKENSDLQIDRAAIYLIVALAKKETSGWESAEVGALIKKGQHHQPDSTHPTVKVELLIAKWFHKMFLGKKIEGRAISRAIWQHPQLETLDSSKSIGHLIIGATLLSLGELDPAKENLLRGINMCSADGSSLLTNFFVYDIRSLFCIGLIYASYRLGDLAEAAFYQHQAIATVERT